MFDKAKELGIDRYGGDRVTLGFLAPMLKSPVLQAGMYMVKHDGCVYPVSTDASVMGTC